MSIRTVIEIDHARINELIWNKEMRAFLERLQSGMTHGVPDGVRILGQRRDNETLNLKVEP